MPVLLSPLPLYKMEQGDYTPLPGLKQLTLKKSFNLGIRSLLTTCSKEEFMNAFPTLDKAKKEVLYKKFVQVISSSHQIIEDEFESTCLDADVGTTLDTIEQLMEEQTLDLCSDVGTGLVDVYQEVSKTIEDQVAFFTTELEKVVKQNQDMKAKIYSLKKESLDSSGTVSAVGMFRRWNSNYMDLSEE